MYRAPVKDFRFVLDELLQVQSLAGSQGLADYSPELAESVLSEAARFSETVLEPINQSGDREGAKWTPDGVLTAKGFKDAYRQFVEGGWPQLGADPDFGGQPMPHALVIAAQEMWASANLSFKLCPMLTQGAVEALHLNGLAAQKQKYLPRMVSGEWTGTMVLTEPHAGSDLGLVRTRAVPEGDHYRLFGQKIFITWGDHDLTPNTIHMVLGRIEGAPAGVKGISLFVVPKLLVNDDGSLGERNEVRCVSIEHKLGMHASPTCVLAFGDQKGAVGYLVGEPNRGLEYMFIMMNAARLSVGVEGYAMAERAFQRAADWARTRVQGQGKAIIQHPDVKRMLLTMKSGTEAMRALGMYAAFQLDLAAHHADEAGRAAAQRRADLLIPVVKAWSTEFGNELTATGVQVHGGMGFVEETGAAQHLRDARITPIYEGTTGIQANDLIGRKLAAEKGMTARAVIAEMRAFDKDLAGSNDPALGVIRRALSEGVTALSEATDWLLETYPYNVKAASAGAVPYLKLWGTVAGGWQLARGALVSKRRLDEGSDDFDFYRGKIATARFFAEHILPLAQAYRQAIVNGSASVLALEETQF